MPDQATQILTALTSERTALQQFVVLLEHEQNLLLQNDTDELLALSEKKSDRALSLNKLAETRRELLSQIIPKMTVDATQDWLKRHAPLGFTAWLEIREMTTRAQQLNSTNGELIQMKMRHNQQSLNALTSAANKASLYGRDGQTSFTPGSGRSLGNG